jgi:hypothetical protein
MPSPHPGLCAECRHVRVVQNRQGSRFYLCLRSREEPAFRRYPALPVMRCAGFEIRVRDPENHREEHTQ